MSVLVCWTSIPHSLSLTIRCLGAFDNFFNFFNLFFAIPLYYTEVELYRRFMWYT